MSGEHFGIPRDGDERGDFRLCPRWSVRDGAGDPSVRKFEERPFERGVSGDLARGRIQKMNHGGVEAKALQKLRHGTFFENPSGILFQKSTPSK